MNLPAPAEKVAALVNERLAALFGAENDRWRAVDPDLAAPFGALGDYVMAGGKRLRPAFCYWAFVAAGGNPDDPAVIDAGAALEMLHTAALVHDDIIDGSARRHGVDTVHVRFAGMHRAAGWSGAAGRFGEAAAILVGDLALVYSSRLLAGAPAAALAVFEEMRLEVNVGQYLDVVGTAQGVAASPGTSRPADRARMICLYKTAKYTIERPLHLGAALGAADSGGADGLYDLLSEFALPLGEAFQLRDDLLGVYGDPAATGKPVGDDLREGKPTLLAALAAQGCDGPDRQRFQSRFGAADLTEDEIRRFQLIIETTGARAAVEARIAQLLADAESALARLPLAPEGRSARDALGQLARFVAGRDR